LLKPLLYPLLYPLQAANDASPSQPIAVIKPSPAKSALATTDKPALPQASSNRLGSSLPNSLMPAQKSLIHGARLSLLRSNRLSMAPVKSNSKPALSRNVDLPDGMQIPQVAKRTPY